MHLQTEYITIVVRSRDEMAAIRSLVFAHGWWISRDRRLRCGAIEYKMAHLVARGAA